MTAQQLALLSLPFTSVGWVCCFLLVISLSRNIISDYLENLAGIAANSTPFVASHQVQGVAWIAMQTRKGIVGYRFRIEVKI